MPSDEERISEIKAILRSLLISNSKLDVTVKKLNILYKDVEGTYIPYREFHFNTLEDFLLHLPDTLRLQYNQQNQLCVKHVDTEKSAHVSSLVSRQKKPLIKRSKSMCNYNYKPRYPTQTYYKPIQSFNFSPATTSTLLEALQELKRSPAYSTRTCGLRKSEVMTKVKEKLGRYSTYTIHNLNKQLFELSYLLIVEGDFIYFKDDLAKLQESKKLEANAMQKPVAFSYSNQPASHTNCNESSTYNNNNNVSNKSSNRTAMFNGQKESSNYTQNNYVQKEFTNYIHNNDVQKESTNSIQNKNTLQKEFVNHIQMDSAQKASINSIHNSNVYNQASSQIEANNVSKKLTHQIHDEFSFDNNYNGTTTNCNDINTKRPESLSNSLNEISEPQETNLSDIIKDRTKIRLQKLIEKHPEGIWCALLPSTYKEEYGVTLEYEEAGFNSILEFVAALPDIFHISDPLPNTNRRMLLDAKNPDGKPNSNQTKTLASQYNFDEYVAGDPEPIPFKLSSSVSQKLIPEGVMSYNETVDQVRVSSLIHEEYIEVVISEIFTPSFFWVHLRKYKKKLKALMENLDEFYNTTDIDVYKIPQIILQPGLNIACTYARMWHRGIIKKIKPDGYIVILFYDYGTVKTYHPNDLYFLNKKFSYLPAQAIPCGLYNIKPVGLTVEWSQEATDEFNHRIWNVPLVAFVCDTDEENNTMIINLIDTSDDLTDVHISDWMVENEFAQYGKMGSVPLSRLLTYDEDSLNKIKSEQSKSKRSKRISSSTFTELPLPDTRESCVSPNPSSNYIDSTYEVTHVASLVKENMDLTKQTNTIAQAILLNMPISKSNNYSDSNLDFRNIKVDNSKDFESQETGEDAFTCGKLDDKLAQDLKNSLGTIKVNISEMNNNYYGSEFINNDPMLLKLSLKEAIDNKSVQSLFSNVSNCENVKQSTSTMYNEKELVLPKQSTCANDQRRPSIQSTKSNQSNVDSHLTQEDVCEEYEDLKYSGSMEHDRLTIKNGTITFEKVDVRENPKINSINIKYPTKFAESYCGEQIESKSQNTYSERDCNESSNPHEEDDGYASKYSCSNLTSVSQITNTKPKAAIKSSVYTTIYLSEKCKKKPFHIFHLDNEGWVCTIEVVDAFTNLKDQRVMLKLLQILEYNVNFKNLLRDTHPDLFSQLDKSLLKVPRDENKKIVEDFVLILMPLKGMLQVLVKLDFLDSKVLKEAIALMKQSRENIENVLYELYNNRIMYDALNLLFQYRQFKHSLRLAH